MTLEAYPLPRPDPRPQLDTPQLSSATKHPDTDRQTDIMMPPIHTADSYCL